MPFQLNGMEVLAGDHENDASGPSNALMWICRKNPYGVLWINNSSTTVKQNISRRSHNDDAEW